MTRCAASITFAPSAASANGTSGIDTGARSVADTCVSEPRNPGASNVMLVPGTCSRAREPRMRTVVVSFPSSFFAPRVSERRVSR
jgi:hypothetical protein